MITVTGSINVGGASALSTVNSTTTPLNAGVAFTGTSESTLPYGALLLNVFSDQASAAGGLQVEWSQNGTNWDYIQSFTISASLVFQRAFPIVAPFFRIVYTNGRVNQATFRLQVEKSALRQDPFVYDAASGGLTVYNTRSPRSTFNSRPPRSLGAISMLSWDS